MYSIRIPKGKGELITNMDEASPLIEALFVDASEKDYRSCLVFEGPVRVSDFGITENHRTMTRVNFPNLLLYDGHCKNSLGLLSLKNMPGQYVHGLGEGIERVLDRRSYRYTLEAQGNSLKMKFLTETGVEKEDFFISPASGTKIYRVPEVYIPTLR